MGLDKAVLRKKDVRVTVDGKLSFSHPMNTKIKKIMRLYGEPMPIWMTSASYYSTKH